MFPWLMVGLSVCLFVNKTNKKIVDECSQFFFWGGGMIGLWISINQLKFLGDLLSDLDLGMLFFFICLQ